MQPIHVSLKFPLTRRVQGAFRRGKLEVAREGENSPSGAGGADNGVFIYWDNSNIYIGAQSVAIAREEGPGARNLIRVNFENMLRLAHADRPMKRAVAAGSVPPEMRRLWYQLEAKGVEVHLFDRGENRGEQDMPDKMLQLRMLEDGFDNNGHPGIIVLLTGDGAGFYDGAGFHRTVERLHRRGWRVEILAWGDSCNVRMRKWAEENGAFIPLEDYYESVTYLEPSRPGFPLSQPRESIPLDISRRPIVG